MYYETSGILEYRGFCVKQTFGVFNWNKPTFEIIKQQITDVKDITFYLDKYLFEHFS